MIRALAIAALAAAAAAPAHAQEPGSRYPASPEFAQCMKGDYAARGNPTAVDMCIGTEEAAQEYRLGQAYDELFDALTGWDQVRFYNDHNDWRAGLEGRCADVAAKNRGGDHGARAFRLCKIDELNARIAYIEDYFAE